MSSTQETTTFAGPLYPTTSMVGNVLFSTVEVTPAIDPADLPSIGNLNRTLFSAGCSTILTSAEGYRPPPGLFIDEQLICLEWMIPTDGVMRFWTYCGTEFDTVLIWDGNIGALLRGTKKEEVERGQVLAAPGSIKPHKKFKAEIYALSKEDKYLFWMQVSRKEYPVI